MIRIAFKRVAWLALVLLGIGVSACDMGALAAPTPTVVASLATERIEVTPTAITRATATLIPTPRPLITPSSTITLTLWIVEEIAPGNTSSGRLMRNQFNAFTAANPNIHIEVVPKKTYGKGGLVDFLTTTQAVAPARLPDLIALDFSLVPTVVETGLLQPVDELMPAEWSADLFPFAYQVARARNHWMAVPFAADIEHLVYNKTTVRLVPKTWDDLIKGKAAFALPLGGDDGFLLQYFALGATLTGAANQTAIDANVAAQVFGWVKRTGDAGLIPEAALGFKTVDEVWPGFAAGQFPMAQVSASRYLAERAKLPNALYAAVPTRDGRPATIATGWAFALVATDAMRQAAVARFIQWTVQGERLAPWLRAAHLLPASRGAVTLAIDPPDYAGFIRDELEHATALPPASSISKQSDAWRTAMPAVWKGQVAPEEAARTVALAK